MAQTMNNKNKNALYNVAITALGTLGFIFLLGVPGAPELREEMEKENAVLGYEKHKPEDMPTTKDSAKAGAMAAISFVGALALYKKKENQK